MKKIKVVFITLFKYSEKKFDLPINCRESYKKLFKYFRDSNFWDFSIYENGIIADEKSFYRIINTEIDAANRNNQQIIFFLIGRGQTLIRNKTEKKHLFGLYGYLPGKLKNTINIIDFLSEIKIHINVKIIVHSENIDFGNKDDIYLNNFVCINDNLSNNNISHVSLTFERIFRKIIDIDYSFQFKDFISQLDYDLNFNTKNQLLYNTTEEDKFQFINYPLDIDDKSLLSYLINNIYNPSKGSREDGFNDLKDLFANPKFKEFAFERLKVMLKLETDSNLSFKIEQLLKNADGGKTVADFINGKVELVNNHFQNYDCGKPTLKHIPGGITKLGTNEKEKYTINEIAECSINIHDFWLSENPITLEQYLFYLINSKSDESKLIPDNWISVEWLIENRNHPVTNVSYYDANSYCFWLTEYLRKLEVIKQNQTFRIPTEAEWEKVCRGINQTIFPWGDNFEKGLCNVKSSGHLQTTEVGFYDKSGNYECFDLIGNVWEWTSSLWGTAPSKASYMTYDNFIPEHFDNNDYFVVRGGAYYFDDECSNCVTRNRRHPNDKHSGGGFRIVLKSQ